MKLFLVKNGQGQIVGIDGLDQVYLDRLEPGESIECDTRKARNPGRHKKFFALFDRAFKSQSKYGRPKELMIELKLRAGWYDEHVTAAGKMVYVPRSLKWAQMGQEEFDRGYRDAVVALAVLCEDEDVQREADEIIAKFPAVAPLTQSDR